MRWTQVRHYTASATRVSIIGPIRSLAELPEIISNYDLLCVTMSVTTIPVSKEIRDRLNGLASKGETYDALLRRLIEDGELRLLYERERRILETEEFIPLDEL